MEPEKVREAWEIDAILARLASAPEEVLSVIVRQVAAVRAVIAQISQRSLRYRRNLQAITAFQRAMPPAYWELTYGPGF